MQSYIFKYLWITMIYLEQIFTYSSPLLLVRSMNKIIQLEKDAKINQFLHIAPIVFYIPHLRSLYEIDKELSDQDVLCASTTDSGLWIGEAYRQ